MSDKVIVFLTLFVFIFAFAAGNDKERPATQGATESPNMDKRPALRVFNKGLNELNIKWRRLYKQTRTHVTLK